MIIIVCLDIAGKPEYISEYLSRKKEILNMRRTKKSRIDRFLDIIDGTTKFLRSRKVASGALVAAIFGALLKLTEITKTFPPPADTLGNVIIFAAVLAVVVDICKGGLFD